MKTAEIQLELLNYIQQPPITLQDMYKSACSSDTVTMDAWKKTWITNITANKAKFGSFAENSIGKFWGVWDGKPCIVAGAGPSLKLNAKELKDRPSNIGLIACLHSFHFLEDLEANVDFYVSLDAGPVTIEEVSEGGSPDVNYWEKTKGKKLLCYIGTHPDLLAKWQGEVYFFNAPIPDAGIREAVDAIEPFHVWVSNGGNVLGACMYLAKGFFGCGPLIFVGADFSFSNREKVRFHAWDSKYDADLGQFIRVNDIYGNTIKTWGSYWNFKLWFDYVTNVLPGLYINATEGGVFGAYREGNIMSVLQLELKQVFDMFSLHQRLKFQCENPTLNEPGNQIVLV
jgi:hypothetical protein